MESSARHFIIGFGLVFSLLIHWGAIQAVSSSAPLKDAKSKRSEVKINVVEKPPKIEEKKPEPKPEPKAEEKTPEPKPAPKPKAPPKPKGPPPQQKKPAKQTETPPKPQKAVQGLSKDSFAPGDGPGLAAPVGNTMMKEDEGIRLSPKDISELDQDLSQDAKLDMSSWVQPAYTIEAEEAELETTVTAHIFINEKGSATQIDFERPIGYGMDKRLKDKLFQAQFSPRLNQLGKPIPGWLTLKFRLTLP